MDRTREFYSFSREPFNQWKQEEKFYVTLYNNILDVKRKIVGSSSYKSLLVLEDEYNKLSEKTNSILDSIKIGSDESNAMHFEGIKQILKKELFGIVGIIQKAKNKKSSIDIELAPEKPGEFKRVNESLLLEQENKRITQGQDYEQTRIRLLKIDTIQKAIGEHLQLQDERIDSICNVTANTSEIYGKLADSDDFGGGSFLRRAVFVILLCLSFVLLFLHFFYK